MGLLPAAAVDLVSDLPPAELHAALGRAIGRHDGAPFDGETWPGGFRIRRVNEYRTTFLPVVSGSIAPRGAGSALRLRVRPHATVLGFLAIWLSFLAVAGALAVAWRLRSPGNSALWIAGPLLLGALTWRIAGGVLAAETRWTIGLLLERVPGLRPAERRG